MLPNSSSVLKENGFYDQKSIDQSDNFFLLRKFDTRSFGVNRSATGVSGEQQEVLLYRVECLDYGVVQVKDLQSAADEVDALVFRNLLCVLNVKIKGLIYLEQLKGLQLQFTNRGQSSVLVTLAQTSKPVAVSPEDFLTSQATSDLFEQHDTSDRSTWISFQSRNKKSSADVAPAIRICIFLMIGCLLLCVMVRRREQRRTFDLRRRLRMHRLQNLDDSELAAATTRFDRSKYDRAISKRQASEDFGPFGEKK